MANALMPYIAKTLSSQTLKYLKRQLWQLRTSKPVLEVFIRIDDPYSYLLIQTLPKLLKRFNVKASFHTVLEMDNDMFPELEMWREYANKDAAYLAELYQLAAPLQYKKTRPRHILESATSLLLKAENTEGYLEQAHAIFEQVWQSNISDELLTNSLTEYHLTAQLNQNQSLLKKRGHYLGAMIHFRGEWYWGLDRLDHLEERLISLKLAKNIQEAVTFNLTYKNFCAKPLTPSTSALPQQPLTLYWSARSPYSYLGLERAIKLTKYYNIPLEVKPILPMMMRGMNVPQTKKMYIFLDTKREAQKHSIPYGFVADPLGVAVERCYALLEYARKEDKLIEFLVSFSSAVNAEGIRAETDQGLKQIVERCGLQWNIAKKQLTTNDQWRKQVNDNLNEMFNAGCWGVPSFSYNNQSFWGQDRLGIIEHKIRKNLSD